MTNKFTFDRFLVIFPRQSVNLIDNPDLNLENTKMIFLNPPSADEPSMQALIFCNFTGRMP